MSHTQIDRALWLVKLLRQHGRLTRDQINLHWRMSPLSNGCDIPRRTFITCRDAIATTFHINIACDPHTYEYYIEDLDDHNRNLTAWMLHTQTMNEILVNSRDLSQYIFLEDVPSARSHLQLIVRALRERHRLRFDYAPYTRTTPSRGVILEPYFLKLFKQRWYVTGHAVRDGHGIIKTYALDRMLTPTIMPDDYTIPRDFDPETYFHDSFGIVFTQGRVKEIKLRVDPRQAKYFRALPLHHSQQEMIHDTYSIFTYHMKISPDFVEEILSHGSRITVLQPPELRAMVLTELHATLANYPPTDNS